MDKLNRDTDGSSLNIVQDNIEKLKNLFPDSFAEGKIDFDKLKATLGDVLETQEERYHFSWHGKAGARRIAQTPSTGTLRPCKEESKHWDTTQNLFIEGDNLEVLKLLQKSYHKRVKMIYIDPPYNTGKEFIYPDNYQDNLNTYLEYTGQKDSEGRKFGTNAETSGRYHTNWLNMMYPRLKLARNLLRDDGVIFISIDDNEVTNLRKICDEIFGEENFVAQFVWKARKFTDARAVTNVSTDHEYILAYAKNSEFSVRGVERDESKFSNPDNDSRGPWMSRSILGLATKDQRPNLHYDVIDPNTDRIFPPNPATGWRYSQERMNQLINAGCILFPSKDSGRPREKKFRSEMQAEFIAFRSIIDGIHTADGTQEIRGLFGAEIFSFPKPHELIKSIIEQATDVNDIVLDFFSGSATAAHAVMDLNAQDASAGSAQVGKRKFIMVQLPEPCDEATEAYKAGYKNIADIGKERIRRAGEKILKDYAGKEGIGTGNSSCISSTSAIPGGRTLDIGFKVLKLASSNIKPWDADFDNLEDSLLNAVDNIKDDRSEDDVLYEILLKYGLDLAVPIAERQIAGKTVYVIGLGALVICLADAITLDVVEGIGQLKGELAPEAMRVVFKDSGFQDDVVKTNAIQSLKKYGIDDVKSL